MFTGFSPETIDFLWGIRFNNNRPWFQERKETYQRVLYEPMKALADDVGARFSLPGSITKVSRIYKDARYSTVPYKDHLWLCIRPEGRFWSELPSVYFQIEPEGGSLGFVYFSPAASVMEAFRQDLKAHPRRFPKIMKTALASGRFEEKSVRYKKPKEGFEEIPKSSRDWYQLKNCYMEETIPAGDELFSLDLPDRLVSAFELLRPVYEYFEMLRARGE